MKIIPLTRGQEEIVDDGDFDWISQWKWYASWNQSTHSFYAARMSPMVNGKRFNIWMHKLILGIGADVQGDHKNRITLDNRRNNLKPATPAENLLNKGFYRNNTSGFKGVYWREDRRVWESQIRIDGKNKFLGRFGTAAEANNAYQLALTRRNQNEAKEGQS